MLTGAMVLLSTPKGNVIFGYGTTKLGAANPPRADIHFRAASNTKTMTAAAIVQMVQERKLSFDDPISRYVKGVPNGDEITIGQLRKMRSGLFNFTNAPELAKSLDDDPDKVWTADEVLAMAFKRPPGFAPGAEYEYSNTGAANRADQIGRAASIERRPACLHEGRRSHQRHPAPGAAPAPGSRARLPLVSDGPPAPVQALRRGSTHHWEPLMLLADTCIGLLWI
jgi:hypothetical protein